MITYLYLFPEVTKRLEEFTNIKKWSLFFSRRSWWLTRIVDVWTNEWIPYFLYFTLKIQNIVMLYYSRSGKNQGKRGTSWRASLLENPPQIFRTKRSSWRFGNVVFAICHYCGDNHSICIKRAGKENIRITCRELVLLFNFFFPNLVNFHRW